MTTRTRFKLSLGLPAIVLTLVLISACTPTPPPTLFIAPRAASATLPPAPGETPIPPTLTPKPVPTSSPTATPPCTDSLAFVEDVTIPDGTVVSPGATIDKRWRVKNDGTCNWDSHYRLKLVGGQAMGVETEQALYPARAGNQATIEIAFIAPSEPGTYSTAWQAINPDGEAFGIPVFMQVTVQPEAQLTIEIIDGGQ